MKHCNKCNTIKSYEEYYRQDNTKDGFKTICKSCVLDFSKKYYPKNKTKIKKYIKEWDKNNTVKRHQLRQRYIKNNKEKMMEYDRVWKNEKYMNDELFKLKCVVASRIRAALGDINEKSTIEHLGCDIKFYKEYLTNMFSEDMSWDNYGTHWEIDHITPLAKGGALHYSNTQPLTIFENRSKGARIINEKSLY